LLVFLSTARSIKMAYLSQKVAYLVGLTGDGFFNMDFFTIEERFLSFLFATNFGNLIVDIIFVYGVLTNLLESSS